MRDNCMFINEYGELCYFYRLKAYLIIGFDIEANIIYAIIEL